MDNINLDDYKLAWEPLASNGTVPLLFPKEKVVVRPFTTMAPPEGEGITITGFDWNAGTWQYIKIEPGQELPDGLVEAIGVMAQNADLSDEDALSISQFYPEWIVGKSYKSTEIVRYEDNLYRIVQDHTSQEDWRPDTTASLYSLIKIGDDGIEEWIAPTGSHDAYEKGAIVRHNDRIWESIFDGMNVWEPGTDETLWREKID